MQIQLTRRAAADASSYPPSGSPGWLSLLAAIAAGLALAAAFPPVGIWPLAMAGPALLTLAVWGKGRLVTVGLALTTSTVFFVLLLTWLVNVAWYAWVALVALEAGLFTVAALALRPLLRLRAWPVAVAGWWVAEEALRDRFPYGGVPWGRLAMSQPGAPTAGWAAIGGPPLVTFVVALAGSCLAYLVLTRRRAFAAVAAVLALGLALTGDLVWRWTPAPGPTAIVAAVQGNVPHSRSLPKQLRETTVTANHASATMAFATAVRAGRRPAPDVVIWPENSTDIDPALSPPTYATIASAVAAIDRPVLVGAVLQNPLRNTGELWLPGRGPVQVYVKRDLVPFGEVIPFRGLIDTFSSLPALQPVNFTPGNRAVVFAVGKVRLGDVICWEVGFDRLVLSEVQAGANLLTVQTNDADFELDGQLGETYQQLAMARMDAITTGREVVVVSTTGVSAFVAPDGSITAATRTWQRSVLDRRVPLESALTPADRVGSWPELAIVALTALAVLYSVVAGRRSADGAVSA